MPQELEADQFPVAIIGAGPIGLAAAAHVHARRIPFVILEAGTSVAASIRDWSHIRLFTPWRYNVDVEAVRLLEEAGWIPPDPTAFPTGDKLISTYLEPLVEHPQIKPHLRFGSSVMRITRDNRGKLENDRDQTPFALDIASANGTQTRVFASAVIDASGSWKNPNPIGSDGFPVPGETELGEHIAYGPPDILGTKRSRYANKRVMVIGSGHSALNALNDLVRLSADESGTRVIWALRSDVESNALSGCDDGLTERALLKHDIREMVASQLIETFGGIRIEGLELTGHGIVAQSRNRDLPAVDEIIVATGFRPDHSMERELRLDLHHTFESPHALAGLIDPSMNACGTVPPHGVARLSHPELDFFIAGMKSYGRAPTFLLLTGYEQVRSVVCAIARDEAAFEIQLDLPERGLCAACTAYLDARNGERGCSCALDDGSSPEDCCTDDELIQEEIREEAAIS